MAQTYDPNGGHDQGFTLGPAVHDTPYADNPLLIGGYASNAAPTSVSAVADADTTVVAAGEVIALNFSYA